jgi:hypothetical protein
MMILSYLVKQSDAFYWKAIKLAASSITYIAFMLALWFNI